MAYRGPAIVPGISAQVLTNIPPTWDAAWFREWALNYLQYADVRNANGGAGIVISGGINTPAATVALSQTVQDLFNEPYVLAVAPSDTALTAYRLLTPEAGVLTVTVGAAKGDVTVGVAANGIGNAQIRQSSALSVIGNATDAAANVADIDGTAAYQVLSVNAAGTALAFAALALANLPPIGNDTVLGNISGGSAAPTALTQAQLTALINDFTTSLSGAVPSSPGGTADFLRADGSWAAPAYPTSANPSASIGLSAVDGSAATFMTSDSAPALSQAIAPSWTGQHTFKDFPVYSTLEGANGFVMDASGADYGYMANVNGTTWALGYGTSLTALGTSALTWTNAGIVNIVGGMADFELNGTALQAIVPTWTGAHTFTPGSGVTTLNVGTTLDTAVKIASTAAKTMGFYGTTPVAQRTTTTQQHTSLLNTTATTYASSQANNTAIALQEVMNTLFAYGLWGTH